MRRPERGVLACHRFGGRLCLIALMAEVAVTGRFPGISSADRDPAPHPARVPPLSESSQPRLVGTTIPRCSITVPDVAP